jgi:predicted transcriptional regulator
VSQILSGRRNLTPEQTNRAVVYLGLTPLEAEYFFALVQLSQAGTPELRQRIQTLLGQLKHAALEVRHRVGETTQLQPEEQARFYSNRHYVAARIATSLPQAKDVEAIARILGIPRGDASLIVEFLLSHGLIVRDKRGKLALGPQRVHVARDSPFVTSHHRNWRSRGMERLDYLPEEHLAFTSVLTLSRSDFPRAKKIFLEAIAELGKLVDQSVPERIAVVTLDFWGET